MDKSWKGGESVVPGISTRHPVRRELAEQGYSLLRAQEIELDDDLRESWLSLSIDFADLPPDEYLPGDGKYRFRRYGRFRFAPGSGELKPLPHVDYFQSADINRVTGGTIRKFAPMLEGTFGNPFLRELIRFDFDQFPLSLEVRESVWEVQAHLIRVTASAEEQGHPTPEGIHRDGAEYVSVHLAERLNAQGGDVSIYDNDKRLLASFRLEDVMDCYLFHDASLWHQASPITPIDKSHQAVRSILTFDYHLRSDC